MSVNMVLTFSGKSLEMFAKSGQHVITRLACSCGNEGRDLRWSPF